MRGRSGKVEKKYARTLLELSKPEEYEARAGALRGWAELLGEVPELKHTLDNPGLSHEERRSLVDEVSERCAPGDQLLKNFVAEVVANGRAGSLAGIAAAFQAAVDEAQGIVAVQVTSAFALDDPEREQLKREMEQALRKQISVQWAVDPAIIGGLVIRAGDRVLDNSLSGSLQRAKREFLA